MPGRRTRTTIGLLFSYVRGRFLEHPRVWLLPQSNPDGSGPLAQGSRITPGPLVTRLAAPEGAIRTDDSARRSKVRLPRVNRYKRQLAILLKIRLRSLKR